MNAAAAANTAATLIQDAFFFILENQIGLGHSEQTEFWTKIEPVKTDVERFFQSIKRKTIDDYCSYWESIKPVTNDDYFRRWIFAFLSVHTTWENNVKAYNLLKDLSWIGNEEELESKLKESRVGLHNNRKKYITKFANEFYADPSAFIAKPGQTKELRDSLFKNILGLGIAKTSFAIEMMEPIDCEAVCMDTHLFQFYKLSQNKHHSLYKDIENHWNKMCKIFNVPNYIARCLFWDINQKKEDSRYWSHCLED